MIYHFCRLVKPPMYDHGVLQIYSRIDFQEKPAEPYHDPWDNGTLAIKHRQAPNFSYESKSQFDRLTWIHIKNVEVGTLFIMKNKVWITF